MYYLKTTSERGYSIRKSVCAYISPVFLDNYLMRLLNKEILNGEEKDDFN